jgi:broad specificity phosphatase PhoE
MPLTVIFVRHGESQANIDRVFANRPGDQNNLTPVGVAQAESLARALAGRGISHVYTSPLLRASQTAAIIARMLGVPLIETDALREYDVGDYEGLPYGGDNAWRWERYMAVEQDWRDGVQGTRHPGGESLTDLEARFLPLMHDLAASHEPGETVLAVSHGGFLRAVLPSLLPDITRDHAWEHTLGHGDRVTVIHEDSGWRCVEWIHTRP